MKLKAGMNLKRKDGEVFYVYRIGKPHAGLVEATIGQGQPTSGELFPIVMPTTKDSCRANGFQIVVD